MVVPVTDRRRIALVVVVVFWAGVGRAQDFAALFPDMECPEQRVCPPPPPLSMCGHAAGWNILLIPSSENPLDLITLRITCGERVIDQAITGCGIVTGTTTDGDGTVSPQAVVAYGGSDCQPVPEPGFAVSVMLGALGLAWRGGRVAHRHSRIGRDDTNPCL